MNILVIRCSAVHIVLLMGVVFLMRKKNSIIFFSSSNFSYNMLKVSALSQGLWKLHNLISRNDVVLVSNLLPLPRENR